MKIKLLVSLILFVINSYVAIAGYDRLRKYCYSDDDSSYSYFGTMTPYDNVRSKEITSPSDCWIEFIWELVSHGTRHVTDSDMLDPQSLNDIRDVIIENHDDGRGQLCTDDLDLLNYWQFPWKEKSDGELAVQGKTDMENLAERWRKKFPTLIASPEKFQFQSSSWKLPQSSAAAFRGKIFGSKPDIRVNNDLFTIGRYINASANKELDEFTRTNLVNEIVSNITTRLGYTKNLTFDFVIKLYKQCALEKANNPSDKSAFCSIFIPDHLKVMEYYDDLDTYYAFGYGDKNSNRACSLARELYQKLDDIGKYNNLSQKGAFYFGQGYNVLTLLIKLGLFFDTEPLKHDNYEQLQNSRLWRTSKIDPFASNFVAVMYNCSQELKVSFYVNEGQVQYPGCDEGVCLWSSLKEKFEKEILKDCSVSELSAAGFMSVHIPIIFLMVVLIYLVN